MDSVKTGRRAIHNIEKSTALDIDTTISMGQAVFDTVSAPTTTGPRLPTAA